MLALNFLELWCRRLGVAGKRAGKRLIIELVNWAFDLVYDLIGGTTNQKDQRCRNHAFWN
jgi:hypothetical protein